VRQASLVKNPVGVQRDTVRARADGAPGGRAAAAAAEDAVSISLTFDALRPGRLTVHLLVTEVEQSPEGDADADRLITLLPQAPECGGGEPGAPAWAEHLGSVLDSMDFEAGLGQAYRSPPVPAPRLPAERLVFDRARPADVPVAVRLEAAAEAPGEPACVHYVYLSLRGAPAAGDAAAHPPPQWRAEVFAQKLQYGGGCFVLFDVFGAASERPSAAEPGGGQDCVICLSEPRDTAVLPCRHMCFCSHCAGIVRLQCERCPVCRQKVKSLLQFKRGRPEDPLAPGRSAAL